MSMNFSNLKNFEDLADSILREYGEISHTFSSFQKNNNLDCVSGCGKCCFKPDIYCSPIELLPLAMELLKRGEAQEVYEKCLTGEVERCYFLDVDNAEKYQGKCSEYQCRPLVCRTFGVSARHGKKDKVEFSVCKVIKEQKALEFQNMISKLEKNELKDMPFIDLAKNQLSTVDPRFLEKEYTINQSLKIMLEKVLLLAQYT